MKRIDKWLLMLCAVLLLFIAAVQYMGGKMGEEVISNYKTKMK